MLKSGMFAALFLMLFFASAPYAIMNGTQYAWNDGTTAPIECVEKCRSSGVLITEKTDGDVNYLSEACKSVCYETNAVAAKASVQTAAQNSANNTIKNGEETIIDENEEETVIDEKENSFAEGEELQTEQNEAQTESQVKALEKEQKDDKNRSSGNLKEDGWENAKEVLPSTANIKAVQNREEKNARERQEEQELEEAKERQEEEEMREYISNSSKLEYSDIKNATSRIKITAQAIGADDKVVEAQGKEISANVNGNKIKVRQAKQTVQIVDEGGTFADAPEATLEEGVLSVEGQKVKIMPSQAKAKIKGEVKGMQIRREKGGPAYQAQVRAKAKIFGIFDTEYDKEVSVDAQSGQILRENRPWWAFVAFE